jgi:ankyrin repeat protein
LLYHIELSNKFFAFAFVLSNQTLFGSRYLEPVELTELLCYAVDTVNEPLVHLLLQSGASANAPDFLAKKTPLQYATNETESQAIDDANANLGAAALGAGSSRDASSSDGGVSDFTENPMMRVAKGSDSSAFSSSSSSSSSSEAHARARIRKALVDAGAQVFIASDSTASKKTVRNSVCGNSSLHRRVWLKKECALLSPEQQAEVESTDDDLGRSPLHHAASRGQVLSLLQQQTKNTKKERGRSMRHNKDQVKKKQKEMLSFYSKLHEASEREFSFLSSTNATVYFW